MKQRPKASTANKAKKAARRARKLVRADSIAASDAPIRNKDGRNEDWQWHRRPDGKRRKGPPPQAPKITVRPSGPAGLGAQSSSSSKLAPALLARLAVPIAAPPVVAPPDPRFEWPHSEWMAVAALFLPALLTITLLATAPRRHPAQAIATARETLDDRTRSVAQSFRSAPVTGHVAAVNVHRSRPLEPLGQLDPVAESQLAAIVQAFARELTPAATPRVDPPSMPSVVEVVPPPRASDVVAHAEPTPPASMAIMCSAPLGLLARRSRGAVVPPLSPDGDLADDPLRFGQALAAAAVAQTRDLVVYNAAYMTIAYPRGDVPDQFGVCTDVVIRAYRALDIDLQELVHQTRAGGPSDPSIDHRRTELLRHFFAIHGEALPITPYSEDYLPGDIVTYYRPQNRSSTAHIAVVTAEFGPSGRPLIAHNRGWGVQLEDALFVDQMTGHYRFRGRGQNPGLNDQNAVAALGRGTTVVADIAAGRSSGVRRVMGQRLAMARLSHAGADHTLATTKFGASKPQPAPLTAPLTPPMGLGLSPAPVPDATVAR